MFSIGIVGLTNAGKSTLFSALTKIRVKIAEFPFTTIEPNIGIIPVKDERLNALSKLENFEKITPTTIKFIDIAGLIKGAHQGEGLGNQFLSLVRECDGILKIIRCFDLNKEKIIDDFNTLEQELIMKDIEILKRFLDRKEKKIDSEKYEILKNLEEDFQKIKEGKIKKSEIKISKEEKEKIKEFQFITLKPAVYIFNIKKDSQIPFQINEGKFNGSPALIMNLKEELEISDLTEKEKEELKVKSNLEKIIKTTYNSLSLITFYTIAKLKEARAWTLKLGDNILDAAEKIHSDFKEKFIKAEVINWKELINIGSWKKAKDLGKIKIVSKDYIVQDGDVIEFKI